MATGNAAFYDVGIIGGGPAGLTAAATLARQLHTAVVFDSKKYRNERAPTMNMVPGALSKDPAEFRRESRGALLSDYSTVEFQDVQVTSVKRKGDSHFSVADAGGREWKFRKLLLAVGSVDIFPKIDGFEALWGVRIFHCLFCKGYEDRGASSAGVLAVMPIALPTEMLVALAVHAAGNASQLSESVTFYTNGNKALKLGLKKAINSSKKATTWKIEPRVIRRLAPAEGDSVAVEFEDGSARTEKFLVNQPLTAPGGPFAQQLGLATSSLGDIQAEAPFHQTSVRGVFAAGDCMTPYKVIPGAIATGCNAAVGLSTQLQAEKHGLPSLV